MAVSVVIPDSVGLQRGLRSNIRHRDKGDLDQTDLAQYDRTTLFYDVFFNPGNDRLCLLGPPLLNLQRDLLPLRLRLNGIDVSVSIKHYFKQRYVDIQALVNPADVLLSNRVELDFNGVFSVDLEIARNQFQPCSRVLTTLQKNNRPHWIREWVRYYQKYFDIDAIVLYDNGSDDIDTLHAELEDVIIENWDFPFGIVKSHYNKFCQYGSLNHCRLKYGSGSAIFNFDIDEILCVEPAWLDRQLAQYDVVMFDSYQVPYQDCGTMDYSYGAFSQRQKANRRGGKKYIYRDSAVVANNVHFVRTVEQEWLNKIQKELMRLFRKMRKSGLLPGFATWLSESISATREARLDEGYFLHFGGITTNWKAVYHDRLMMDKTDDQLVDIDPECLARIRAISISASD